MFNKSNTFCISLLDDTKRRDSFNNQMKRLNIEFTVFDAIDCREFKTLNNTHIPRYSVLKEQCNIMYRDHVFTYYPRTNPAGNNIHLHTGYIGCTISHLFLYKKLIEDKNNEFYLIFEDGFYFTKNYNESDIISSVKDLPEDFDICFFAPLNAHRREYPKKDTNITSSFIYEIDVFGYYSGASMCIISKKGATKFLNEYGMNVVYAIDDLFSVFSLNKKFNAYATYKFSGYGHMEAWSGIEKEKTINQFDLYDVNN